MGEDVQQISEMQYKEQGDSRLSISMMIEAVLATKLPGVLLAEEDLRSVSFMFVNYNRQTLSFASIQRYLSSIRRV